MLNKQYFNRRKAHKENSKKRKKWTFKKVLLNLIFMILLTIVFDFIQDHLNKRVAKNVKNDHKLEDRR